MLENDVWNPQETENRRQISYNVLCKENIKDKITTIECMDLVSTVSKLIFSTGLVSAYGKLDR